MGERLEGLDALRGIAALCVVVYHAEKALLLPGTLAVDLFFMASGYIMARTYEPRFAGGFGVAQFLKSRVRRLWFFYAVGCALGAAALLGKVPPLALGIGLAGTLLFLPVQGPGGNLFFINPPGWSLFCELVANLFHKAISGWSVRNLTILLLFFAAPFITTTIGYGEVRAADQPGQIVHALTRTMTAYLIGILIFRTQAAPNIRLGMALLSVPILFIFTTPFYGAAVSIVLIFVAFPLIVSACARAEDAPPLLRWLGTISYPLYAVHYPLMMMAAEFGLHRAIAALISIPFAHALASMFAVQSSASRECRPESHSPHKPETTDTHFSAGEI